MLQANGTESGFLLDPDTDEYLVSLVSYTGPASHRLQRRTSGRMDAANISAMPSGCLNLNSSDKASCFCLLLTQQLRSPGMLAAMRLWARLMRYNLVEANTHCMSWEEAFAQVGRMGLAVLGTSSVGMRGS